MKKLFMIFPLALVLCFMVGCQNKAAMAELEEQNKEIMTRWFEETYKGNLEAWDGICSEDYVSHFAEMSMNLEEHKQAHRLFSVAFPDIKHEINSLVAEEDRVTTRITVKGTHEGEFMGIPPTGNKINYTGLLEARFSEGKIVEVWGIGDMLTLMQQLGMELKPKEEEK